MVKRLTITIVVILVILLRLPNRSWASTAFFSLNPQSRIYHQGDIFIVDINLDTGRGRTSGADVYLNYDKDKLKLIEIIEGKIFTRYVGKEITNILGYATISGLASSQDSLFAGYGLFATLKFEAIKEGEAQIRFKFTPGDKNDCNVSDFDKRGDILTNVENASFTIQPLSSNSQIKGKNPSVLGEDVEKPANAVSFIPKITNPNLKHQFFLLIPVLFLIGVGMFIYRKESRI